MSAFDKVIGYDDIKSRLTRVVDYIKHKEKYEALGAKKIAGIILDGDPGVGKTLMANCFIEETGLPSYVLKKDKSNGDFVRKIKSTFKKASENTPSIILLDDLDRYSNSDKKHKNTDEYIVVQSLIDEVKDKDVYIIATTNDIDLLPESLVRQGRFDLTLSVPAPSIKDAESILKFYIKDKKCASDVDASEIAKLLQGNSCAVLESILNEAGVYCAFDGRDEISMDDILNAFLKSDYQMSDDLDDENKAYLLETAYHEAGHAVMQEFYYPGSVVFVTILENRRGAAGMTKMIKDSDIHYDVKAVDKSIRTALAGMIATEIQFGKYDIGGSSDLSKAFVQVKRKLVNSLTYGLNYIFDKDDDPSQAKLKELEKTVQNEVKRYMDETRTLLKENFALVTSMANALMEKKILRAKDILTLKSDLDQNNKQ